MHACHTFLFNCYLSTYLVNFSHTGIIIILIESKQTKEINVAADRAEFNKSKWKKCIDNKNKASPENHEDAQL